jgi:DNA-cytosine methyltransferase
VNVLDLFSGIGGFSLGLESTGFFKTIAFVEKDKFCQKVLQKNFPNIPIEDEVRNVKGERFKADVITGGFPCQPFSVAGKRKGTDDDRYLWDETIRIVSEQKPKWFIGENVEGIINIQDGLVFRQIHDDLESEGFEVQSLIIPASGIGAWHQRKRVWIIAYSDNNGSHRPKRNATIKSGNEPKDRLSIRNDKDVSNSNNARFKDWTQQHRREQTQNEEGINSSSGSDIISHTKSKRLFSSSQSKPSVDEQQRLDNDKKRNRSKIWSNSSRCGEQTLPNSNSKRLERHRKKYQLREIKQEKNIEWSSNDGRKETWWQTQSKLCGIPDGVSTEFHKDRVNRIKALGNSIVPQIAREIGKAIIKAETNV